jgi:hypothetical protein
MEWEEEYARETGRSARVGDWYSSDYVRWLERLLNEHLRDGKQVSPADALFVALGRTAKG